MRILLALLLCIAPLCAQAPRGLRNPGVVAALAPRASGGGGGCTTVDNTINGATTGNGPTQNSRYFAQRFTAASSATACSVVLRGAKQGTPSGNLTIAIYSHNATGNGTPNASLGSATTSISALGTTEQDVSVTVSVSLTSGTVYWVVIDDPTNGGSFSGSGFLWYYEAASSVANNSVNSADGASWSEYNSNTRFKFITYK